MTEEIFEALNGELFAVWFLIGTALVFWMQAGFAMVEAGFTRAKNTGNIIMKNLMDFCIGTVMFILIGFGFLLGEDMLGLIGKPGFDIFTSYANFDWSNFVFNLVFCATTATIVSGAMAERTKFLSYCVYSAVISGLIYPIEAHWVWGGGWLAQMGFHDFAGSTCIHMVGGICALIGAKILGPRIGKFHKNKDGKITRVNAFPGHNLALGALGVFILWLGWYGFNGAAATSVAELGSIFVTTTIAPAIATVVCMIYTWIKYKHPDVSMCLNASLAGLVAVTASCDVTDALGSIIIGAVAGLLVIFGVWLLDYKLHIDDPVGAVAVHCMNGIWGTIAVGLFATDTAPAFARGFGDGVNYGANQIMGKGLFYGGGFDLLVTQLIGMVTIIAFTAVTITITFLAIKAIFGLRVTAEEEITGLDATEHGLDTAYAGFLTYGDTISGEAVLPENAVPVNDAVPVQVMESEGNVASDVKISKVSIVCKQNKFEELKDALNGIGVSGITVTNVLGCGVQKGSTKYYRGVAIDMVLLPKIKVEVIVSKVPVAEVLKAARKALYTGNIGDGKIFVYDVENVIKVRTGEEGFAALQGEN
ncbi:MAG: ammonium transporter [Lachnospiraceae bacterium]|nr:ammonium transporter [Lachnospiraceae bacterium]